jgi:hypothetical protein
MNKMTPIPDIKYHISLAMPAVGCPTVMIGG